MTRRGAIWLLTLFGGIAFCAACWIGVAFALKGLLAAWLAVLQ